MSHKEIAPGLGTSFGPETTKQGSKINPGKVPPLMSPEGEHLASVSAPSSAFELRNSSTAAVRGQKK